jgi:polyphosphate kinase 2 (PPK2 family)
VRRKEKNREEVWRVRRGEVTAAEVFEERMKRRVAGEEKREADEKRREERRLRKKEAWLQRKKEAKVAAMTVKREAAKVGRQKPMGGFLNPQQVRVKRL